MNLSRRRFFAQAATLAAGSIFPLPLRAADKKNATGKVRIGLIADIHQDIMHDAPERLGHFLKEAATRKADALVDLGDFCIPKPANRAFADLFEAFPGRKYHAIGNHDMDGGFTREQVVAFHKMPARYYRFELGGITGLVLDGNDTPPDHKGGYPSHIDDTQIAWLERELAAATTPVFIFSHQSLERPNCIRSQEKVRAVLEAARHPDGTRKVAACLNGHWHLDLAREINGIPYLHINSASYYWLGDKNRRERYDAAIHKAHPFIACTAPYRDALFTFLEIDLDARTFTLSAARSEWVGPSPQEMNAMYPGIENDWVVPACSARDGKLPA